MIVIFNPTKQSKQPFFQALINYLHTHNDVTLRQIKQEFSEEKQVDKQMDSYIEAGYIVRENRRYRLEIALLDEMKLAELTLDEEVFVETDSPVYEALQQLTWTCELTNDTNAVIIKESVDFVREDLTLSSYFYKLREQLPLSSAQQVLYDLLGDVNQAYALKYMTTFLLKFARKDIVLQKRPDIFVQALVILGFIEPVDETSYRLTMDLDKEHFVFTKKDKS